MDAGVMVAEQEGDLEVSAEDPPLQAGGEKEPRKKVEVNPFWSSRAVEEATLRAMRPEGLPPIPDTVSPQKENMEDAQEEAGGLHEGDPAGHGRERIGGCFLEETFGRDEMVVGVDENMGLLEIEIYDQAVVMLDNPNEIYDQAVVMLDNPNKMVRVWKMEVGQGKQIFNRENMKMKMIAEIS
ncbi:unnamed protein product, partial [Effrenium voratum]